MIDEDAHVAHHEPIRLDDLVAPHEVAPPEPKPPPYFRPGEEPLVRMLLLILRAVRAVAPIPKPRPRQEDPEDRRHHERLHAGRLNALLVLNAVLVAAFVLNPAAAAAGALLCAFVGLSMRPRPGLPGAIPWIVAGLWLLVLVAR